MKRALWLVVPFFFACPGVNPVGNDAGSIVNTGGGTAGGGTGGGATGGGGGSADASVDAGTDAGVADAGIDAGTPDAGTDPLIIARPFAERVPVSYVPGTPTPLVVLLHGYTATAATQDAYFQLSALAQSRGFLLALPDGTRDSSAQQFWNATNACCGFGETVDDVAYLTAVIEDMKKRFTVDPKRIFLIGHSNGGFMSHRMACDRAGLIAGIVSLAGAVWNDASLCMPSERVNILQVHGTIDAVIAYAGGANVGNVYPGAETTVQTWATKNGCTGSMLTPIGGDLDLTSSLIGDDTSRLQFTGCPTGGSAELWRINGGSHVPAFNSTWGDTAYTWLMAHPKP
ncbi:MAG: alpha/beta fold hydrolase [Archangium sp.]|nr:alpha/beta fold hydrolase [Archangium sp.]